MAENMFAFFLGTPVVYVPREKESFETIVSNMYDMARKKRMPYVTKIDNVQVNVGFFDVQKSKEACIAGVRKRYEEQKAYLKTVAGRGDEQLKRDILAEIAGEKLQIKADTPKQILSIMQAEMQADLNKSTPITFFYVWACLMQQEMRKRNETTLTREVAERTKERMESFSTNGMLLFLVSQHMELIWKHGAEFAKLDPCHVAHFFRDDKGHNHGPKGRGPRDM